MKYNLVCFSGLKRSGKDTCANMLFDLMADMNKPVHKVMLAYKIKEFLIESLDMNLTMDDMNGDSAFDREEKIEFTLPQLQMALNTFLSLTDEYLKANSITTTFDMKRSLERGFDHLESIKYKSVEVVSGNEFFVWKVRMSIRDLLQIIGTDIARLDDDELWSKITANEMKLLQSRTPNMMFLLTDLRMDVEIEYMKDQGFDVCVVQVERKDNDAIPNHITDMGISKKYVDITIHNDGSLSDLEESIIQLEREFLN